MGEINWEKWEKEFGQMPETQRTSLYEGISYISIHCQNCKVLQEKGFGFLRRKFPAYTLPISGEVTDMVCKLLSTSLTPEMNAVTEAYKDAHINYNCEEGVTIATELQKRASNYVIKK